MWKKKPDDILLHFGTSDAPCKNEEEIRLSNKNANSVLKNYVDKLMVVQQKFVILHDNILSSHLNKDGLYLDSFGTIKLAENFIPRIRMFWCNEGSYKEFKCFNSAPTLETSNSVSFDNFGLDKNSPGFLFKHLHLNHPKNIVIGHLNINPIRNKFDLLKKWLQEKGILIITTINKYIMKQPNRSFFVEIKIRNSIWLLCCSHHANKLQIVSYLQEISNGIYAYCSKYELNDGWF